MNETHPSPRLSARTAPTPDIDILTARYAHLRGYHANEWDRFIIITDSHPSASQIAAQLGWWLHCWRWTPTPAGTDDIVDTWADNHPSAQPDI